MMKVYGTGISQPTRCVRWALALKGIPYEYVEVDALRGACIKPDFLAKFPLGTIPSIEEPDGFCLSEANAILLYLTNKYEWFDWYPDPRAAGIDDAERKSRVVRKARVDQWLHFQHLNLRPATAQYWRPLQRVHLGAAHFAGALPKEELPGQFAIGAKILKDSFLSMEYGALRQQDFLAPGGLSLADLAAYCELDQLEEIGGPCAELLEPFTYLRAWMDRMKTIPHHDEVRVAMRECIVDLKKCIPEKW